MMRESCQSQITDRLLHRGKDILDCSSICVTRFYCIWLVVHLFFVK